MALSFLHELLENHKGAHSKGIYFLSGATDGNDGPTDAAGAFAFSEMAEKVSDLGLSIEEFLNRNDSYHFYFAIDGLLKTGPTNTNVCDIQIMLVV